MASEGEGGAAALLTGDADGGEVTGATAAGDAAETANAGAGGGDAPDWLKQFSAEKGEGEEVSNFDYLKGKGFKDLDAVVKSLRTFEAKARGGGEVAKPGEGATPEEIAAWNKHIGVPDTAEGYAIEVALPEGLGLDEGLVGAMREVALGAGVPAGSFKALAEGLVQHQLAEHVAEVARQDKLRDDKLSEWGGEKDANLALYQRGMRAFGLGPKEAAAIQKGMGSDGLLEFGLKLGRLTGEETLLGGGGNKFGMSKAEAQAEIDRINGDADLRKKVFDGDPTMKARWDNLNKVVAWHTEREKQQA